MQYVFRSMLLYYITIEYPDRGIG